MIHISENNSVPQIPGRAAAPGRDHHRLADWRWVRFASTFALALFLLFPVLRGPRPEDDFDFGDQPFEPILKDFNETSSGLASGLATPDGRPLLWKSRDRGGTFPNEFPFYDNGGIPFIGLTDNGSPNTCYGGINLEGFALENTDAHNVEHGPHNDGRVIYDALSKCRTVDDFAVLLDSADRVDPFGRYGYDYGVIDAYGGAAIYEAFQFGHRRYDAVDAPDAILIRSNFAYQGPNPAESPATYGLHRHNRSMELFKDAVRRGAMTPQFIYRAVARDLTIDDFSPYPLPFHGYYQNYAYGCIDNSTAICRSTTTAVMVAQGVRAGERPDDAILWSMNGSPVAGIMTPLWVRAGSTPLEYDGPANSRINSNIIRLYNWVYQTWPGAVDTWKLTNPQGTGLWDFLLPIEEMIFAKTERFLNSPRFSYDRLESFQRELAQQVADSLQSYRPTYKVTEVTGLIFWDANVELMFGSIQPDDVFGAIPRGYDIYRSNQPFREASTGDYIGTTTDTLFVDRNPLPENSFYQVLAVF
jgi:hypothetical protein